MPAEAWLHGDQMDRQLCPRFKGPVLRSPKYTNLRFPLLPNASTPFTQPAKPRGLMNQSATSNISPSSDRNFFIGNFVVSLGVLCLLAWLLLMRKGEEGLGMDLTFMPALNATFNALSACLLVAGIIAIKNGQRKVHQSLMISAFVASSLFLIGYLIYHYIHGDSKYTGEGLTRTVYFVVLISHILLSIFVLPLALTTFYFAWGQRFDKHRFIAKFTFPIWLYVSVTGVVIFFMLRNVAASGS